MSLTTGFIGLGAMGAAMARNLHRAGLLTSVWNRTAAKAQGLAAELGIQASTDPASLAAHCDCVVLCVSADADVLAVVDTLLPGLRAGTLVIDMSTVSRDTACLAAGRIAAHGGQFLDAPVSGGVEGARQGTLSIMVGGDASHLDRARAVLEAIGSRITHMGPVGAGQATKAVNQVMAAGINQAVCEALAFAAALQLPLEKVIEVTGAGAAGNWFLQHRGLTMTHKRFAPGFKVALHHKDLGICQAMAKALGCTLPLADMTRADYQRLMDAGHGEADISALYLEKTQGSPD